MDFHQENVSPMELCSPKGGLNWFVVVALTQPGVKYTLSLLFNPEGQEEGEDVYLVGQTNPIRPFQANVATRSLTF